MSDLLDSQKIHELEAWFRKRIGWQSFSPTLHQSAAVGATVTDGRYRVDDGLAHVMATLTATAAGTVGNAVYIILPAYLAPATGSNSSLSLGIFSIADVGGPLWYTGFAAQHTTVGGLPAIGGIAHGLANSIGIAPSFALASGDIISVNLKYRI